MNDIQIIQQKIHEIRGQRVILDYDLAELYQVTTGNLNKAVKRNIRRFPPDFMFQLTKDEFEELKANLIFHFGISRWGGTRKLPHAFTEQGVAMLSGILNSTIAIDMNIAIMRAFVAIRQMAATLPPTNTAADLAQLRQNFEDLQRDLDWRIYVRRLQWPDFCHHPPDLSSRSYLYVYLRDKEWMKEM